MKLFTFAAYLFALSATFWLVEVGVNGLNEACDVDPPGLSERIKITIMGYLGYLPPEAPWWRPLCNLTSPDMNENVNMLHNYLVFCVLVVFCFGSVKIRNPVRGKYSESRRVPKKVGKQKQKDEHNGDLDLRTSDTGGPVSIQSNNSVVLTTMTFRNKAPALLYQFWSIRDVIFKDPVIPDSVKRNCLSDSLFKTECRQERPLQMMLTNMKRYFLQNSNNSNVSQNIVEHNLEEIIRPSESPKPGRFDEVLLGPVTKSLEALIQVVATNFKILGIPDNTIKWSTVNNSVGAPSKIMAQCPSMMAEIEVNEGIDLTIYRVTGIKGLIRSVSYQTFRLTYRGLVLYDESSTCMCGPGWHF